MNLSINIELMQASCLYKNTLGRHHIAGGLLTFLQATSPTMLF